MPNFVDNYRSQLYDLGGLGRGGIYDPAGNRHAMDALRQVHQRRRGARERAAVLAASLGNRNDPSLSAFSQVNARLGAASDSARSEDDALLETIMRNQDRLHSLAGMDFSRLLQPKIKKKGAGVTLGIGGDDGVAVSF